MSDAEPGQRRAPQPQRLTNAQGPPQPNAEQRRSKGHLPTLQTTAQSHAPRKINDGAAMPLRSHETFVHLETDDFESFLAACQGVDTVVHLAADPRPNGDFHTSLLPSNIVGVYNAFEAAHQAGCQRLLFASSVHSMLGYNIDWSTGGTGDATDNTKPPNPTNTYGATKAWGEALCHKYSNSDGLSCIALRVSPTVPALNCILQ